MEYYEQEKNFKENFENYTNEHEEVFIRATIWSVGLFLGFTLGKRKGIKIGTKGLQDACDISYKIGISNGKAIGLYEVLKNAISSKN